MLDDKDEFEPANLQEIIAEAQSLSLMLGRMIVSTIAVLVLAVTFGLLKWLA